MTHDAIELLLRVRRAAVSAPRGRTPSSHVQVQVWREGAEPEHLSFERHAPAVDFIEAAIREGAEALEVKVCFWDWETKQHTPDDILGVWEWRRT